MSDFGVKVDEIKVVGGLSKQKRIDYISNFFCDFKVYFNDERNISLRIPKACLCESELIGIGDESLKLDENDIRGLKIENLSAKVILSFIMEDRKNIFGVVIGESLVDYFLFFKALGLYRPLGLLFQVASSFSFNDCFRSLKRIALSHENSNVKSWFDGEVVKVDLVDEKTFDCSLSLALFNILKEVEKDVTPNNDNYLLIPRIGILLYHFKRYENIKDHEEHKDFRERSKSIEKWSRNKNVKLISTEGTVFSCHRVALVYRSNFFYHLLCGTNLEKSEFRTLVSSEVLSKLIEFCYYGCFFKKGEPIKLESIIQLISISQTNSNQELLNLSLDLLSRYYEDEENLLEKIQEFGYLVHTFDEDLKKYVIDNLTRMVEKNKKEEEEEGEGEHRKKIEGIVSDSYESKQGEILNLEIMKLREENTLLRGKCEEKARICLEQSQIIVNQQIELKQVKDELQQLRISGTAPSAEEVLPPRPPLRRNEEEEEEEEEKNEKEPQEAFRFLGPVTSFDDYGRLIVTPSSASSPPIDEKKIVKKKKKKKIVKKKKKKKKKKKISNTEERRMKIENLVVDMNFNDKVETPFPFPKGNYFKYSEHLRKFQKDEEERKRCFMSGTLEGYAEAYKMYRYAYLNFYFMRYYKKTCKLLESYTSYEKYSKKEYVDNLKKLIITMRRLAECMYRLDHFDEALEMCKKTRRVLDVQFIVKKQNILYLTYALMGRIMMKKVNLKKAEKYISVAEELKKKSKTVEFLRNWLDNFKRAEDSMLIHSVKDEFDDVESNTEKWVKEGYTESENEEEEDGESEDENMYD